ncbi:hypothetical protein [Nocardia terrae]|nr:hypothetical protein [Nocardia terrae]
MIISGASSGLGPALAEAALAGGEQVIESADFPGIRPAVRAF